MQHNHTAPPRPATPLFYAEKNVALWDAWANKHARLANRATQPGLRVYHADRRTSALLFARLWRARLAKLQGVSA